MLVTSQLQFKLQIFHSFFDVHLRPHTLKKVPPPLPTSITYFIIIFKAFVRNSLYGFVQRWPSSSNVLSAHFICVVLFTNLRFFSHNLMLLCDDVRMQWFRSGDSGRASAPPEFWFVKNLSEISKNLGKEASTFLSTLMKLYLRVITW